MLTEMDHKRIAEAITQAESKTSGEIFCVLAHEVSRYREVPLAWASLAALVLAPLAVLVGWTGCRCSPVGRTNAADSMRLLFTYGFAQACLFLVVVLIVSQPGVRRLMTPRFLKRHRVRQVARHHFVAGGARLSHAEPHILIYASLHDRQVELVAHESIHRAVGEGPWNAAVAAVTQGMKAGLPVDGFVPGYPNLRRSAGGAFSQ